MLTIPRSELLQLTELALWRAEAFDADDERMYENVAATVDRIAVNTWRIGECGCLVGSLHLYDPLWSYDLLTDDEWAIGLEFDGLLRGYLERTQPDEFIGNARRGPQGRIVEVTD